MVHLSRIVRFLLWRTALHARARRAGVTLELDVPLRGAPARPPRVRFGGRARSMKIRFGPHVRFGRDVVIEHAGGDIEIDLGEHTSIGDHCRLRVRDGEGDAWEHRADVGVVRFGARCEVRDFVVIRCLHRLIVGDDVMVSHFCMIHMAAGVTIGSRCTLAERVTIASADHTPDPHWTYRAPSRYGPITLADNVLVSANAVIARGVDLPFGVIVGAGAVVTRGEYEPGDVIVGRSEVRNRDRQ